MITFACKTVDLQDIIKCSLELTKTDYALFTTLLEAEEPFTVAELAGKQGLERSSVQKAISRLQEKRIIERRQHNLAGGGYRYSYSIADKEELRKRLQDIVEQWYGNVRKALTDW